MTSIEDRANESEGPEVVLTSDLGESDPIRIASDQLVEAAELTPEDQFPNFGEFLECRRETDGETVYWECSVSLADVLVSEVEEFEGESALIGTSVDVDMAAKAPSGEWRYSLDVDVETELMDNDGEE